MQFHQLGNLVNAQAVTGVPTAPAVNATCAPIALEPTVWAGPGLLNFNYGGDMKDVYSAQFTASFTASGGTSPTAILKLQGCSTPFGNNTTINGTVGTGTTSIAMTARDGIPQNGYLLFMSADGLKSEWVFATSAAATGSGSTTVTRAQFGTTATTFAAGDLVFWITAWVDIPTSSGTVASSAVSLTGAAISTPINITIDTHALGLTNITYPVIRPVIVLGGTSPTGTVTVRGALKTRGRYDSFF